MKLFVHPTTRRYLDYGSLLSTEVGISWSADGDTQRAFGFEPGKSVADVFTAFALSASSAIELLEGEPVERALDLNPRGLV